MQQTKPDKFNWKALRNLILLSAFALICIFGVLHRYQIYSLWTRFWVPHVNSMSSLPPPEPRPNAPIQQSMAPASQVPQPAIQLPLPDADTLSMHTHLLTPALRNNRLWMHDSTTNTDSLVSPSDWSIDRASVSPNKKYVAVRRISDWIDSPGLWDDTTHIPKEPIFNIAVFDCQTSRLIRDIDPPEDLFLNMQTPWLSNSRLMLTCSDGFAVNAVYVYDAYRDTLQKVPYDFGR